ncbi:TrmB family transcriptional regulator [Methanolobus sp.]|jgi:sugar-specific transcriptional regulator TrmB|uniref:TrmB family transcriptional regulator n=1 Tax=Methanolobus sp. TaxID=1874737 RepID=UPI0025ED95AA|nr:helix-turn-helix domain-containing protein [Methanolobus sp.]
MENEQLLRNIGFNKYESVAYLTTLKEGLIEATDLSKLSKIPMGKIYAVLENLDNMGFIEVQHSRPKKYRAVEANIAFENYYLRKEHEINRELGTFRETIDTIEGNLSHYSSQVKEGNIFWSAAMGNEEVMKMIRRVYRGAKKEICVVVPRTIKSMGSEQFKDMFPSIFNDTLLPLMQKEVKIKIIDPNPVLSASLMQLKESVRNESIMQNISKHLDIRYLETLHKFVLIDKQLVILEINDPINSDKIFGMVMVNDPIMSKELHVKFKEMWSVAKEISDLD